MSCDPFRTAVSAQLDGESPGLPAARLDEHLAGCAACREWADAAAEVTRRARLAPATPVPDVTAAVLAALAAAARPAAAQPAAIQPGAAQPARRRAVDGAIRLALLAVGAGQLAVGLPTLTSGAAAVTSAAPHLTSETAAWNLGLGVCFLVVAGLPRLAAGSLPFLVTFTAVLGWVTVRDLGAGHVHPERAGVHLLLVVGALLVGLLALRGRAARGGPAGRGSSWSTPFPGATSSATRRPQPPTAGRLGDVGPVTGRAA